jgi:D-alanine-D-alanine ligase
MCAVALSSAKGGIFEFGAGGATQQQPLDGTLHPPRRRSRGDELRAQVDRLLSRASLAVIYGGDKNEDGAVLYRSQNLRSWKSYKSVAEDIAASLERLGARSVAVLPDDVRLVPRLRQLGVEMAWLNTGGVQGANSVGHAAAMLELAGVPYVGHDPMTGALLDAKHVFKRLMVGAGVPTAEFITHHGARGPFDPLTDARFSAVFRHYRGPFIVKPVSGRASLHVEYVEHVADLATVANRVFEATQNEVMIERYLGGREFCVAVCGPTVLKQGRLQRLSRPFVFCCMERVLDRDERVFTSMDHKPITSERIRLLDRVTDGRIVDDLEALGARVFEEMQLDTLVRLDVRADASGELFVLEANPKPDLKAPSEHGVTSIIAESLGEFDLQYDDLIYALFADKIDVLMSKRRGSVNHLLRLIEEA